MSTSSPSSRKKPSSRATSSGRSWIAFIIETRTVFKAFVKEALHDEGLEDSASFDDERDPRPAAARGPRRRFFPGRRTRRRHPEDSGVGAAGPLPPGAARDPPGA